MPSSSSSSSSSGRHHRRRRHHHHLIPRLIHLSFPWFQFPGRRPTPSASTFPFTGGTDVSRWNEGRYKLNTTDTTRTCCFRKILISIVFGVIYPCMSAMSCFRYQWYLLTVCRFVSISSRLRRRSNEIWNFSSHFFDIFWINSGGWKFTMWHGALSGTPGGCGEPQGWNVLKLYTKGNIL